MKKLLVLFFLILSIGCNPKDIEKTEIIFTSSLTFEYAKEVYLHDILKITEGTIITDNYLLDTTTIGTKKVEFKYRNNLNKERTYKFDINVVDTIKPTVYTSSFTTIKGKNVDFVSNIIWGDNYDRSLTKKIEGNYDINTIGTYQLTAIAIDSSNNLTEKKFKLNVVNEKTNSSNSRYLLSDLIKEAKSENTTIGIDVSSWQGDIDWLKVKNAGVEAAMIRIGFGHNKNHEIIVDSKFINNLKGAKQAGIKVGLYFYSYATTNSEAVEQARWIINQLNGEKLDLPIAFDWEVWTKLDDYKLNFYDLNNIARSFIEEINKSGYTGMLYSSAFFLNHIWTLKNQPIWLAYYTTKNDFDKPYSIWQLSSVGKVDGINTNVDLNVFYKK